MKIVFLDIDGVLNSQNRAIQLQDLHKRGLCSEEDVLNWDLPYEDTLSALKRIVDATGAEIVLSSTWRRSPERVKQLNERFRPYGFQIYGKTRSGVYHEDLEMLGFDLNKCYSSYEDKRTGKAYTTDRGAEIALWISEHPGLEGFVILDDDSADIDQYYGKEHVATDFRIGLTMELAEDAIHILNGDTYATTYGIIGD